MQLGCGVAGGIMTPRPCNIYQPMPYSGNGFGFFDLYSTVPTRLVSSETIRSSQRPLRKIFLREYRASVLIEGEQNAFDLRRHVYTLQTPRTSDVTGMVISPRTYNCFFIGVERYPTLRSVGLLRRLPPGYFYPQIASEHFVLVIHPE